MKTKLGAEIPQDIRGIVYFCELDWDKNTLTVRREVLCKSAFEALNLYANIPNPESQMVKGASYQELCDNLERLHKEIDDPVWVDELKEHL